MLMQVKDSGTTGGRVREFGKPSEFEENLEGRKVCRGMTI